MSIKIKPKKYNLKNDIIFNAFFSRKENEGFLIDFLESLLKLEITKIDIREQVNLEKLAKNEKGGRLDLQARLNNGIIVNIELQIKNENNIEKRTLFYCSKTLSREVKRGTDYNDIEQVIMINILDYKLLGFDEYVSETVTVLDKHRDCEIIKGMKWYFIELPKFRKSNPDMNEKLNQWLAFIDDYDKGVIEMAEKKNKTLEKARAEMNYLTGDEEVRRLAELREKWEMDYISAKKTGRKDGLRQGKIEGKKEGLEEGRKEGLEKGKKEGLEKGREESKIQIANKLLEKGMSIEEIHEITGLNKKEIEGLM